MLEGVRILIDRMESHPEEFVYDTTTQHLHTPKFYHITDQINRILQGNTEYNLFSHLTAEEKTALLVAFRKMMRQAFTAQVIATTFSRGEEEEGREVMRMSSSGALGVGQKATGLIGTPLGNAVYKAEGANIAYYGSNGAEINPWR